MPYVQRNGGGTIVALFAALQPGVAAEFLADGDPTIAAYLNPVPTAQAVAVAAIAQGDQQTGRAIEFIVAALLSKGVVAAADLPTPLKTWLANRAANRAIALQP